jgi:hypothetical protein
MDRNIGIKIILSSLISMPDLLEEHFLNPKPHSHSLKASLLPPQCSSCRNLRLIIFSYTHIFLPSLYHALLLIITFFSFTNSQLCPYFCLSLLAYNMRQATCAYFSCLFLSFLNSTHPRNLDCLVFPTLCSFRYLKEHATRIAFPSVTHVTISYWSDSLASTITSCVCL